MDLVDIWRIRNPDNKLFTWKQTKPLIQRRLDFWLISDTCQDEVEQVKIIPSMKSDHSVELKNKDTVPRGVLQEKLGGGVRPDFQNPVLYL